MNTSNDAKQISIPDEVVIQKIYLIRGLKIMLDSDLAALYGVETKVLKQQVKRNSDRFPGDFMFALTKDEFKNLRSQIVTSSLPEDHSGWGGTRYLPMAFTEQGVAMLSSVLKSPQAIQVNIQIIRVFTRMRGLLSTHAEILHTLEQIEKKDMEQDKKILLIFEYLKELDKSREERLENRKRPSIGFKTSHKE